MSVFWNEQLNNAVMPKSNLDDVFGIALKKLTFLFIFKYLLDFIPATKLTILGLFFMLVISS